MTSELEKMLLKAELEGEDIIVVTHKVEIHQAKLKNIDEYYITLEGNIKTFSVKGNFIERKISTIMFPIIELELAYFDNSGKPINGSNSTQEVNHDFDNVTQSEKLYKLLNQKLPENSFFVISLPDAEIRISKVRSMDRDYITVMGRMIRKDVKGNPINIDEAEIVFPIAELELSILVD